MNAYWWTASTLLMSDLCLQIQFDFNRNKYFDTKEAMEYGIIDHSGPPAPNADTRRVTCNTDHSYLCSCQALLLERCNTHDTTHWYLAFTALPNHVEPYHTLGLLSSCHMHIWHQSAISNVRTCENICMQPSSD